jgi:hypothetical protein
MHASVLPFRPLTLDRRAEAPVTLPGPRLYATSWESED